MSSVPALAVAEQISDAEVVRRILEGDTALFEILMRRYNQRMYRAVRGVLRSDDDVEDVLQQAYLNAFTHLRQFAGDAQFSTWLTRIVVNEALGRLRKRGTFTYGDDEVTLALIDTKTPDPERQAASAEMRDVMEQEVSALPDSLRVVFVMRDVEGLSTSETASCLDLSEDVVKTRLHRARVVLRDNLYKRAGVTAESIFTFGNARCDRVVAAVMEKIGGRIFVSRSPER